MKNKPVTIHFKLVTLLTVISLFLFSFSYTGQDKKEPDTGKYRQVANWPHLPDSLHLGQVTGLGIDTNQNVLLFHRAGRKWTTPFPVNTIAVPTILEINSTTGQLIKSWGQNLFIMPHGLTVDNNNNIWVTDVALHQLFKFSHEGKLLLQLGEQGVPGNDSLHFNMPTDIAVCKDGSFYVSDGYGNSRIIKFSKTGHYLFEWGKLGQKPGEFNTPHAIDLDAAENVFVADRENNRIQKFDALGHFINEWKNNEAKQLYSLSIQKNNDNLFAVDYLTVADTLIKGSDIILFDADLKPAKRLGRSDSYKGPACRYHDIVVDKNGNLYVGDILENKIQKFSRRK